MKSLWLIVKSSMSNMPQKMWLAYHIKTQYLWFFTAEPAQPSWPRRVPLCDANTSSPWKFKGANLKKYPLGKLWVNYGKSPFLIGKLWKITIFNRKTMENHHF